MEKIDVVCGVILNDRNEFLITQKSDKKYNGKWEFPGGKVEDSEDCFDSIVREIKEELNVHIEPLEVIIEYVYDKYLLTFIRCHMKSFDIELNEHNNYKWVNYHDLKTFNFIEGDIEFVNKISDYGII